MQAIDDRNAASLAQSNRCHSRLCGKDGSIGATRVKSFLADRHKLLNGSCAKACAGWNGARTKVCGPMKPYLLMLLIGAIVAFSHVVRSGPFVRRGPYRVPSKTVAARSVVGMQLQERVS
jgi:hypothetical protein